MGEIYPESVKVGLQLIRHSPFWALAGVVAKSFSHPNRSSLFVQPVSVFQDLVTPYLHDLTTSLFRSFNRDLPKCNPKSLPPRIGENVQSLEGTVRICHPNHSVMHRRSFTVRKSRHEVNRYCPYDLSVHLTDVKEIATVEVESLNVIKVLVVPLGKPTPVEDFVAGANDVLDSRLVGASGEADLHAEECTGLTPFLA